MPRVKIGPDLVHRKIPAPREFSIFIKEHQWLILLFDIKKHRHQRCKRMSSFNERMVDSGYTFDKLIPI